MNKNKKIIGTFIFIIWIIYCITRIYDNYNHYRMIDWFIIFIIIGIPCIIIKKFLFNNSIKDDNSRVIHSHKSNNINKNLHNKILAWILLIFIPPVGILYLLVSKKITYKPKTKFILTCIFIIYAFCYFLALKPTTTNNASDIHDTSNTISVVDEELNTEELTTEYITLEETDDETEVEVELEQELEQETEPPTEPLTEAPTQAVKTTKAQYNETMVWVSSTGKK
jgi:glucan phosphoethanolaminetransferase (alkaline phosphatase superfamily)